MNQHRKNLRFVLKNFTTTLFNYVVINGILKQLSFSSLKSNKTKLTIVTDIKKSNINIIYSFYMKFLREN